jgi:hypothetical protein
MFIEGSVGREKPTVSLVEGICYGKTGEQPMPKRTVTARLEEKQLQRAKRYLKTRSSAETVKAALDFVAEKAAHEQVVQKYSGVGQPDAFQDS